MRPNIHVDLKFTPKLTSMDDEKAKVLIDELQKFLKKTFMTVGLDTVTIESYDPKRF